MTSDVATVKRRRLSNQLGPPKQLELDTAPNNQLSGSSLTNSNSYSNMLSYRGEDPMSAQVAARDFPVPQPNVVSASSKAQDETDMVAGVAFRAVLDMNMDDDEAFRVGEIVASAVYRALKGRIDEQSKQATHWMKVAESQARTIQSLKARLGISDDQTLHQQGGDAPPIVQQCRDSIDKTQQYNTFYPFNNNPAAKYQEVQSLLHQGIAPTSSASELSTVQSMSNSITSVPPRAPITQSRNSVNTRTENQTSKLKRSNNENHWDSSAQSESAYSSTTNGSKKRQSSSRELQSHHSDDGHKANRWTPEQDDALRVSVEKYDSKNWKAIASEVPGRDHVQCLQRWKKVLRPGLVKGHWLPEEDQKLLELMQGDKVRNWANVAALIKGRTAKQCRERWSLNLDPKINNSPWTKEEDQLLLRLQATMGNRWAEIKSQFCGRTENAVKTRFKSIMRTRKREWTPKQDALLLKLREEYGRNWEKIAAKVPGRTRNALRVRCKQLQEMQSKGSLDQRRSETDSITGSDNSGSIGTQHDQESRLQEFSTNDSRLRPSPFVPGEVASGLVPTSMGQASAARTTNATDGIDMTELTTS